MLLINDGVTLARARHGAAGLHVERLLALRRSQLGDDWHLAAAFHVAEAGDTVADAEAAVGWPLTLDGEPTCEWAARHDGVTEAAFVLSDDGTAQVLLIPHRDDIAADLLAFGRLAVVAATVVGDQA